MYRTYVGVCVAPMPMCVRRIRYHWCCTYLYALAQHTTHTLTCMDYDYGRRRYDDSITYSNRLCSLLVFRFFVSQSRAFKVYRSYFYASLGIFIIFFHFWTEYDCRYVVEIILKLESVEENLSEILQKVSGINTKLKHNGYNHNEGMTSVPQCK